MRSQKQENQNSERTDRGWGRGEGEREDREVGSNGGIRDT